MENTLVTVSDSAWTLIAETDVNYILQNIGAGVLLV